jgi:hypothetical protein
MRDCLPVYVNSSGEPIVSTLQYETIALMGSNLGIGNLDEGHVEPHVTQ